MKIDPLSKLQHLLQTLAFCLAVATIQWGFQPHRPYAPAVAYSVAIGTLVWLVVDMGRHFFPSARETGWPTGWSGLLLVMAGIGTGYLLGTTIADTLCRSFGWYAGLPPPADRWGELRSSLLITLMAGIAGTFYFYSINRSRYLERKVGETRQLADEARLKLLESQLEPHMLFNTLANLRALIAVDPGRAQQMLDHMIAFLRATLDGSRRTTHPLQAEFERLHDYLSLMAVRMGPRLRFTLDLPPPLASQAVPTLLLQPLVENAILHGLEPQVQGGQVTVTARQDGDVLVLEVTDTGTGVGDSPAGGDRHGGGFGLTQVRQRLATLHGEAASLRLAPRTGGGTAATIRLPLP